MKLGFLFCGRIRFIFKLNFVLRQIFIKAVQAPAKQLQGTANIKFLREICAGSFDFINKTCFFPDNLVDKTDPFLTFFRKILQLVADYSACSVFDSLTVMDLTAEIVQLFHNK